MFVALPVTAWFVWGGFFFGGEGVLGYVFPAFKTCKENWDLLEYGAVLFLIV